jgi:hypothetical protein
MAASYGAHMSYLPTCCEVCSRIALVALPKSAQGMANCSVCSGELRVIPSRSYAATEVELFEELSETVTDGLSPLDAYRLSEEVARILWSGSFGENLNTMASRWPALLPLQTIVGNNVRGQQRVLQMLKTIFDALATSRRSEVVAAVGSGPAHHVSATAPELASRR